MKKLLFGFICLFGLASAARAQIQFNIDAGLLENTTGTAAEPVGGLLQLIASPSGTFSAANSSSYISGDNVLVASFAMNYGSGVTGETTNSLINLTLTSTTAAYNSTYGYTTGIYILAANEPVQLRWYPSITYSTTTNYSTSAPALATTYGAVRSDSVEFASDSSETPWKVPASGAVDLNYITSNDGGTAAYTPLSAFATNIVGLAPAPEPSTYAMFAGGFMGLIGLRAWNRRKGSPLAA